MVESQGTIQEELSDESLDEILEQFLKKLPTTYWEESPWPLESLQKRIPKGTQGEESLKKFMEKYRKKSLAELERSWYSARGSWRYFRFFGGIPA